MRFTVRRRPRLYAGQQSRNRSSPGPRAWSAAIRNLMSTPGAHPETAARPGRPVPERIGKYEIIKEVGRGSTGCV